MRLLLRLGVLALVLCAISHLSFAQDDEADNSDEGAMSEHQKSGFARGPRRGGIRRPLQGSRRPGFAGQRRPQRGPLRGNRRPAQYAPKRPSYPSKRPAFKPKAPTGGQYPRARPQHNRPQVAIKKPVYGTAQMKPGNGAQAKYRYAVSPTKRPVHHAQQVQHQQVQIHKPAAPYAAPNAAAAISMPTLANLLYKYAKSSKNPIYNSNPYNIFGSKTYGPMPVPKGYVPTNYQKPVYAPKAPVYRPVAQPVAHYQAAPTYQAPAVTNYQAPSYSRAAVQKSYYASPPAVSCPAPGNFCHYKKAGHYAHPGSKSCFIQCDAFGRAYSKPCSPGTSWKPVGPEPALWNMCS